MKLTSETKFFIGVIGVTILIIIGAMFFLSQPVKPLPREALAPKHVSMRGPSDAKHYLVEFSDFQCPACHAFSAEVDILAKTYPNLLVLYRHYPLPQHANAQSAARVGEAAGNQGKFWEMAALLFDHQEELTEQNFASFAAQLNLNMAEFTKDRYSTATADIINTDISYGDSIGINATPTFYFDGIKMELMNPQDLNNQVKKALQ
jgi:protein-disulfide isomerase